MEVLDGLMKRELGGRVDRRVDRSVGWVDRSVRWIGWVGEVLDELRKKEDEFGRVEWVDGLIEVLNGLDGLIEVLNVLDGLRKC
jgi:hypothetical protein